MGAVVDAIDQVNDTVEAGEKWITEMKPYTFHWSPSYFGWNGRDVSVLLPADTQYSKGMTTQKGNNGFTRSSDDLADASSGIPVSSSGKVTIRVTYKTQMVNGNEISTSKTRQMAFVSISFLPSSVSKEEFIHQLKKKDVQVLAESENSLLTKGKTTSVYGEILEKTIVDRDVVIQIQLMTYGPSSDGFPKQLLGKICLAS